MPLDPADGVNPQILDAVTKSSGFVFAKQTGPGTSAGNAIAYEKAAQAAALAVQDAADYQRNVLSISTAAQGKALAMMFATKDVKTYGAILALALVTSVAATLTAGLASSEIAKSVGEFPSG